jgi:autotransporter-associated beta strand protein
MYLGGAFVGTNYKLMFGSTDATGTVVFQNNINLAGSNNAPLTRGIEVANSATIDVEARISGVLSGSASSGLTKTGAGTLELTGINTYSGSTIVREGELRVTGSLSNNSLISVLEAGILSGVGLVGPITLEAGGTIAPGAGVGTLNTRDLALSGGTLAAQLQDATTFDQLNVTGIISFTSPVNLTLALASTLPDASAFTLIANDGADAITFANSLARFVYNGNSLDEGEMFTVTGGFGTQGFQISYAGGTSNNDVVLTAVPEPGAIAMMLGGFASLVGFQRRRTFPRNL